MGKEWDNGEVAFAVEFWAEILRVLKPGGHVAAFGGTRSYHRLACAIEDAGFEIRDQLAWVYGSGFPKSHDVSKGIDKARGVEGALGGAKTPAHEGRTRKVAGVAIQERTCMSDPIAIDRNDREYLPGSEQEQAWKGWGTALKPSWEPICLARKPLGEATVAANVLKWGTGALNVGATRVEGTVSSNPLVRNAAWQTFGTGDQGETGAGRVSEGRWPANLVHDGSDEVLAGFPDSAGAQASVRGTEPSECHSGVHSGPRSRVAMAARNDSGSAARFFYSAKADADDRLGSKHPTVKPVDLMRWLAKLVTPPGGVILDPFSGTGTTGEAAWREGFSAALIEREPEYQIDIARRMDLCRSGTATRKAASAKARGRGDDAGPLFALPSEPEAVGE
jgi:site-specific DNA-methyltransferase (adenine-specific)